MHTTVLLNNKYTNCTRSPHTISRRSHIRMSTRILPVTCQRGHVVTSSSGTMMTIPRLYVFIFFRNGSEVPVLVCEPVTVVKHNCTFFFMFNFFPALFKFSNTVRPVLSRVQHWECHTIVNIESFRSEDIYWHDFTELIYWCNGSIMNTDFSSYVQEHVFLRYFTDVWKHTSTRLLHYPRISSSSSRSRTYLSQGYGGYMVYILVVVEMCIHYSSNGLGRDCPDSSVEGLCTVYLTC